jgi:hypothetical protein
MNEPAAEPGKSYTPLAPGDRWITINGNHVLIHESGGESGQPAAQLPPSRETQATPQDLARKIPPQIRAEMARAIDDSNRPTADDKKGRFHEEIGVAGLDHDKNWVVWHGKPGPYASPDDKKQIGVPVPPDPNEHYPIDDPKVFFHVHPSGETATHKWNQEPSTVDQQGIYAPGTYIVFGARDKKVYFYDSAGTVGKPMSLKEFFSQPYNGDSSNSGGAATR